MPHRPPHDPSDREINGNMHRSLRVGEIPKDPLDKPKHRVVVKDGDGYTIVAQTEEPLELYALQMQAQHAILYQNQEMAILDDEHKMVRKWGDYKPAAYQEPSEPISEVNRKIRDRWVLNIIQFLLPFSMAEKIGQPEAQQEIAEMLKEMGVEIAVSPTGCGVLMYRDSEPFAAWRCDK